MPKSCAIQRDFTRPEKGPNRNLTKFDNGKCSARPGEE